MDLTPEQISEWRGEIDYNCADCGQWHYHDKADCRICGGTVVVRAKMERRLSLALDALEAERAKTAALTEALSDVIGCDHHNFSDGPPPRFVQIARAALTAQERT